MSSDAKGSDYFHFTVKDGTIQNAVESALFFDAVFVDDSSGTVSNVRFLNNIADGKNHSGYAQGGALKIGNITDTTITDSEFIGNTVINAAAESYGGAVESYANNLLVENTKFSEGMPPYWYTAQDDLFVNLDWLKDTNVDVIATVMDEESDYDPRLMQKHLARAYEGVDLTALPNINKANPVIWTNTYGKGRVFVIAIGHGADTIKRPAFCCLLARGCEWACSGEITIPYPDIQEERRFAAWPYYDNVSYAKVAEIMEGI